MSEPPQDAVAALKLRYDSMTGYWWLTNDEYLSLRRDHVLVRRDRLEVLEKVAEAARFAVVPLADFAQVRALLREALALLTDKETP